MVLTVFGAAIVVVSVNQLRWQKRVSREMRSLLALSVPGTAATKTATLPPPVARYRDLAVGQCAPVQTLNLRHAGTFCMAPGGKSLPIQGTQIFTSDPPGFVWSARVQMAPGIWFVARDMAVAGKGSMLVLLDATFALADADGPLIDQGSALRLLAEMVWYPSALFDARYVTWAAIDESHARATLRFGEQDVSGIFEFGADGLPVAMNAQRFTDKGELRPWGGTYRDWRTVSGMRVPFEASVTWQFEAGPFTYAHWLVETMAYDAQSV